jgi:hypothetical protein
MPLGAWLSRRTACRWTPLLSRSSRVVVRKPEADPSVLNSHAPPLRRRLREAHHRQGERAEAVHERQAQDPGGRHEGYQDGAHPQEGPDGC